MEHLIWPGVALLLGLSLILILRQPLGRVELNIDQVIFQQRLLISDDRVEPHLHQIARRDLLPLLDLRSCRILSSRADSASIYMCDSID